MSFEALWDIAFHHPFLLSSMVQSSMVARLQRKSHRTELVTAMVMHMEPDQSAYYSCRTIWNQS